MKRFLTVLFLMIFAYNIYADEFLIGKMQCYKVLNNNPDNLCPEEIAISYNDITYTYTLQRSMYATSFRFIFFPIEIEKLRNSLLKIKDWEIIAKKNGTGVTKELPNSLIYVDGRMKIYEIDITRSFSLAPAVSIKLNGEEVSTVLVITGTGGKTKPGEEIFMFEPLVFFSEGINELNNLISPETLDQAKAKHQQEKKTAELFQ